MRGMLLMKVAPILLNRRTLAHDHPVPAVRVAPVKVRIARGGVARQVLDAREAVAMITCGGAQKNVPRACKVPPVEASPELLHPYVREIALVRHVPRVEA